MQKTSRCIILLFIIVWRRIKNNNKSHCQPTLPAGLRPAPVAVAVVWPVDFGGFVCSAKYCCPPGKAVGCIVISWLGKITTLKPHNLLPHPVRTSEKDLQAARWGSAYTSLKGIVVQWHNDIFHSFFMLLTHPYTDWTHLVSYSTISKAKHRKKITNFCSDCNLKKKTHKEENGIKTNRWGQILQCMLKHQKCFGWYQQS